MASNQVCAKIFHRTRDTAFEKASVETKKQNASNRHFICARTNESASRKVMLMRRRRTRRPVTRDKRHDTRSRPKRRHFLPRFSRAASTVGAKSAVRVTRRPSLACQAMSRDGNVEDATRVSRSVLMPAVETPAVCSREATLLLSADDIANSFIPPGAFIVAK